MALVPFPSAHPAPPDPDEPLIELTDPVDPEDLDGAGARMSFLEHLDELRTRIIHAVAGVAVGIGLTFFFHNQIYNFVFEPTRRVLPDGSKFVYTQPGEAFALYIQDLRTHKAPRVLVLNGGPASFSPDGKRLAFVDRNRLVVQVLANGMTERTRGGA